MACKAGPRTRQLQESWMASRILDAPTSKPVKGEGVTIRKFMILGFSVQDRSACLSIRAPGVNLATFTLLGSSPGIPHNETPWHILQAILEAERVLRISDITDKSTSTFIFDT